MSALSVKRHRNHVRHRRLLLEQLESRHLLSGWGLGLPGDSPDFEPMSAGTRDQAVFEPWSTWEEGWSNSSPGWLSALATAAAAEGEAGEGDAAVIIDNGEPGYSEVGDWSSPKSWGYQGNSRYAYGGIGQNTATWQQAVQPGTYRVQATWPRWAQHATDTPYRIYDGDALRAEVRVDQTKAASGVLINGAAFETLADVNISSGTLRVVLANDATGGSFVYVVADAVRIEPLGPQAVDDSYQTEADTTLVVPAPGVLANDSATAGQTLTASLVSAAQQGTVALQADGSFTYTPTAGFAGTDSFTYRASDGLLTSDIATVSITVNPVASAPVAADDSYTTGVDLPLTVETPGVLGNDSHPDGAALTALLCAPPAHGQLTLNPDGSFSYSPDTGFAGTDSFTYQATDGQLKSEIATVTIRVKHPPTAEDQSVDTRRDQSQGITLTASDPTGDPLTFSIVSLPVHGTLTGTAPHLTYTPASGYVGHDHFMFQVDDGHFTSALATVTISVFAPNGAPIAGDGSYRTQRDKLLTISAIGVLANDTSPDNEPLSAILCTTPKHGELTLNADGSFAYLPAPDFAGQDAFTYRAKGNRLQSNIATVALTVEAVNRAPVADGQSAGTDKNTPLPITLTASDPDGDPLNFVLVTPPAHGKLTGTAPDLTYTPDPDYLGQDNFTFQVDDGELTSETATVTVTVESPNNPPLAVNDAYSTPRDTPLTVSAPGILTNDSDLDGDALTAVRVDGPANGTLVLNANGSFSYTPNVGYAGTDSFTYRASDGELTSDAVTVTITVEATNRAPEAVNDAYSTPRDTQLTVVAPGILTNESDPDGDALTAVRVDGPANGTLVLNANGSFSYTPNAGYAGTDSFTYQASDGELTSDVATVTITVEATNRAPEAANDAYSTPRDTELQVAAPGILANDSDPDGDVLTAVLVTGPTNGTLVLNANGSFSYTPNVGYAGTDSFTYRASDGELTSDAATVTITVEATNRAPEADAQELETNVNKPLPITLTGSDPDGDALTYEVVNLPQHGTLTGTAPDLTYTPNADYIGQDTFTFQVDDGMLTSALAIVAITVNAVNAAPLAVNDSYSTPVDTPLTVAAPGVLSNDTDPDGDPLTAVLVSGPSNGTLTLNANGSFTYSPAAGFTGNDSFQYRASDSTAESNIATVAISVVTLQEGLVAHWTLDDGQGAVAGDSTGHENNLRLLPMDNPPTWTAGFKRPWALEFDGNGQHAEATNVPVNQAIGEKNTIAFWMKWGGKNSYSNPLMTINPAAGTRGDGLGFRFLGGRFGLTTSNEWPDHDVLGISHAGWADQWKHVVAVFHNPDTTQEGWEDVWRAESKLYIDGVEQELTQNGVLRPDSTPMWATVRLGRTLQKRNWDGVIEDVRIYSRELTPTEVQHLYNPWSYDDQYLRDASQASYSVEAPGVMGNDSWAAGQSVTPVVVRQPEHGAVVLNADGSFTYTPDEGHDWGDSFTYQLTGNLDSNVATVTIFSDAPVAVSIDSYNTHLNTPVTYGAAGGVLHYVTAKQGSAAATAFPLTTNTEATSEVVSGVSNGTLSFNSDGSFTYVPDAGFTGTDSFTYRAYDGRAYYSQVATATITISETSKEISGLATWESLMIQYGTIHGDRFLDGTSDAWQTYYDAQRIFENIADYTGDASWLAYSKAAGEAYMVYVEKYPSYHGGYGAVQGYWNFTHGLTQYHLRTGDVRSRDAVIQLSLHAACTNEMTDYTEDALRSRETAYALTSHINAERVGYQRFDTKTDALYEHALGHLDQWFIDNNHEVDPQLIFKPFMFGLTAEALIFYWDYVDQDSRILEKLQRGADALFSWMIDEDGVIAWDSEREAFWYVTTGTERTGSTGPGTVAPDLNLLIAPLYSWLYLQTGDATYRDRGDAIFAGGAEQAYMSYFKAYNQSYRWSFDYVKWRSEAEERWR